MFVYNIFRSSIFSAFLSQSCRDRPITDSPVHELTCNTVQEITANTALEITDKTAQDNTDKKQKIFHISTSDLQGELFHSFSLPLLPFPPYELSDVELSRVDCSSWTSMLRDHQGCGLRGAGAPRVHFPFRSENRQIWYRFYPNSQDK